MSTGGPLSFCHAAQHTLSSAGDTVANESAVGPALRVPVQLGGWIHSQTVTVQGSQGCSGENSTYGSSDPVWGYMRQGGLHREGHMEGGCAGGWRGSSKLKLRRRFGLQPNVLGGGRVGISAEVGN